jgi:hypothetical protein
MSPLRASFREWRRSCEAREGDFPGMLARARGHKSLLLSLSALHSSSLQCREERRDFVVSPRERGFRPSLVHAAICTCWLSTCFRAILSLYFPPVARLPRGHIYFNRFMEKTALLSRPAIKYTPMCPIDTIGSNTAIVHVELQQFYGKTCTLE